MQFRQSTQEDLTLNLAPLIDVVFLLLIFFMVTTSFTKENALDLSLPEASFEPLKTDNLSITVLVNKSDEIAFEVEGIENNSPNRNDLSNLEAQIQAAIELAKQQKASHAELEPVILIKADRAASHGRIVQLMDAISNLGIRKIQFVAIPNQN